MSKSSNFGFWQKWLTYANVLSVIIGLLAAFAGNSIFFDLHNDATRDVLIQGAEFSPEMLQLKNWLFGIIGGTIVGFHILMIFISENAFKQKEKWAYFAMISAMISWFVIDSGLSIYYGAAHNVLLINLPALIMIGLPLLMTHKYFFA